MHTRSLLNVIHHGRRVPQLRGDVHADGQGGDSVNGDGLMDGQDVAVIFRDDLQHIREDPRARPPSGG